MVQQHHYLLLENNCSPQNREQYQNTIDISGSWCVGMTTNKKSTRINRFIEYHYLLRRLIVTWGNMAQQRKLSIFIENVLLT